MVSKTGNGKNVSERQEERYRHFQVDHSGSWNAGHFKRESREKLSIRSDRM